MHRLREKLEFEKSVASVAMLCSKVKVIPACMHGDQPTLQAPSLQSLGGSYGFGVQV